MKKLNKGDLSLNPKQISNLNESGYTAVPTSKEDCNTDATCQTHCAQATCPDYSQVDENCKETFATRCLCGGNSDKCNTLGCGSQTGGGLCCDTGATCNNCGALSQGIGCESAPQVCEETVGICVVPVTETPTCVIEMTKENRAGEISVCACLISDNNDGCNTRLLGCNSRLGACNGDNK